MTTPKRQTAEERATKAIGETRQYVSLFDAIVSAIRSAEREAADEALERAADALDTRSGVWRGTVTADVLRGIATEWRCKLRERSNGDPASSALEVTRAVRL